MTKWVQEVIDEDGSIGRFEDKVRALRAESELPPGGDDQVRLRSVWAVLRSEMPGRATRKTFDEWEAVACREIEKLKDDDQPRPLAYIALADSVPPEFWIVLNYFGATRTYRLTETIERGMERLLKAY
jgi:hypothetical protein